jgi:glyoxylase-like metal-dependent hydrolase (beta-lactamase superfamily II)
MIAVEPFDDVTRIRLASAGSRLAGMHVSAYLVGGVLVDCGFPLARRVLARLLEERPLAGAMLTHWHEDHAGNAELLASRGVPLAMHPDTEARLRTPPAIRLYRRVVWGSPPALLSPVRPFAHETLRFLPTPGHSSDHQVVWDAATHTVFSGDLWLGVRSGVMHVAEQPRRIVESLRAVIALEPRRMFDAHRGQVRDPVGALSSKVAWLEETIGRIETRIDAGWRDRAILREVFGGDELVAVLSGGEYARMNFVRAVRRTR